MLFGILALLLKPSFFVFMILILVGYFLLIELYLENKKKKPLIIFLTISCVMFFIYGDILFQYADYYRSGLYFDIGTSKV